MSARFQELDRRMTPIGEVTVRRRVEPTLGIDVFEVKLGDEFLMSSLFTAAEIALATITLDELEGDALDIVVGGLGLGYTARAALDDPRVRRMDVVDALEAVIEWHQDELLPNSTELVADDRCHLDHGDFFALLAAGAPFAPDAPELAHAILVDIDHTPRHLLHPSHAPFYEPEGLATLAERLHPGGAFALWSDDPPDDEFLAACRTVFATCEAHTVSFPNFYTGEDAANTVYVARTPTSPSGG